MEKYQKRKKRNTQEGVLNLKRRSEITLEDGYTFDDSMEQVNRLNEKLDHILSTSTEYDFMISDPEYVRNKIEFKRRQKYPVLDKIERFLKIN